MIDDESTKEEILKAVRASGLLLRYASYELSNDPEVVLEALRSDIDAFEYVSMGLRIEMVECWAKSVEANK
jgi:hypothetical protein